MGYKGQWGSSEQEGFSVPTWSQFTDEEGKSQEGKGLSGSSSISNAEEAQLLPIFQSRFTHTHTHSFPAIFLVLTLPQQRVRDA